MKLISQSGRAGLTDVTGRCDNVFGNLPPLFILFIYPINQRVTDLFSSLHFHCPGDELYRTGLHATKRPCVEHHDIFRVHYMNCARCSVQQTDRKCRALVPMSVRTA
jgi:hypothetical protein